MVKYANNSTRTGKTTDVVVLNGEDGPGVARLTWLPVRRVLRYEVFRATGAGASSLKATVYTEAYNDTTGTPTTEYRYKVRAITSGETVGAFSNIVSVTTSALITAPVLTGTPGDTECVLDWTVATGAAGYNLKRDGAFLTSTTTGRTYTDTGLVNGITVNYEVRAKDSAGVLGPLSNVVVLTPVDPEVAPEPDLTPVGYANAAGVSGGEGGTVYAVDSFASFKAAILKSGPRIITLAGASNIDGLGETVSASNGNCTIDGTDWKGSFKRMGLKIQSSNWILTQLRLRPGDQVNAPDDVDALTLNPGSGAGQFLDKVLVDHCSMLWGPDIGGIGILNGCRDVTVQYCIIGAGLYLSAHYEATTALNGHSLGLNLTTIGSGIEHGDRITFYKNFITTSTDRNPQIYSPDHVDFVNNAIYNWERFCPRVNARGLNFEGNMLKIGPQTLANNNRKVIMSGLNTGDAKTAFGNSVFLGGTGLTGGNNFAIGFTKADNLTVSVRRTSRYGTISVAPATADADLFAAVVNAAGPTYEDSIDDTLKAHAIAGTSDGLYNGPSGPAPHPTWPTPTY